MKAQARSGRRLSKPSVSAGNVLTGLFVGLIIGVLATAAVVWYIFKTPSPFSNKIQPPARTAGTANDGQTDQKPAPQGPLTLPGKPGDPAPQTQTRADGGNEGDKPRFDFYKILPGKGEATPEERKETKTADNKEKEKPGMLAQPMYLQTGSYQNPAEADNQKARLAMLGMEATVQQVMLQDKVWYRVRLGPFRRLDDINGMRAELAKQGISASIVKKE